MSGLTSDVDVEGTRSVVSSVVPGAVADTVCPFPEQLAGSQPRPRRPVARQETSDVPINKFQKV